LLKDCKRSFYIFFTKKESGLTQTLLAYSV
jgi:hypothetical protein